MSGLELKFLGDLEVVRAGRPQALPPSRKTRALLAYLALNARSFRREHLCELLWEQPDDPRGSLRWSLSKLRKIVDDAGRPRVVATRTHVGFDRGDAAVDVLALRALVADGALAEAPIETLESAARRYGGHFLEGLDLSSFHDFHAWCVAEREQTTRDRTALLRAIVERLTGDPERALPHARALVGVAPYDEGARAGLIGLLVAVGRSDEAEQQYALGSRMLAEAGAAPTGALGRALRGAGRTPPAQPPPPPTRADAPRAQPPPAAAGALLGRDAELETLATALAATATERQARVVLIRGEPGIGKSRLLAAAAERAREAGARVIESVAFEPESIRPFAIWIDGLRRAAPEAAEAVFGGAERENRERLLGGLSDFVRREADARPLVLAFDDVQWCDESSAAALHYVMRTNREHAVLGIVAARDGELRDNAAAEQALAGLRHAGLGTEIRLGPLAESAVRDLIAERAPGADGEALCRECGGNPLIAIELARAELSGDSGGSLNELVRERLARLDADGRDVLHWAALLAPRADVAMLEHATGLDAGRISVALEAAERQAMVLPAEHGVRFSHELVARGVYADISPTRRRLMHRRVAELLERQTSADLERAADLAHHAAHSGDPALAARAMVSAGRLCLRFFANDEAVALARRGLALVESLGGRERVCLTLDLKDVMLLAAPLEDWEDAAAEYVALAEQALDHGALSHARLGYYMASYVRWMHGHWSAARDQILESERVSRGASDEEQIVGMAEAAKCLALLERDLSQADAMLMEAQALAARRRVAHQAIPAALGMLRFHEGDLDRAQALFEEARTLAKSAGDRLAEYQANEYLAMLDIERGRHDSARARMPALLEIGTKLPEGSEAPFARALDAVCEYALGDETGALERAFAELRGVDAKHRLAYALTRAADIDVARRRHSRAIARAGEALTHAETLGRGTEMLVAHAVLAEAHRGAGDAEAAARHVRSIGELETERVADWARRRAAAAAGRDAQEA